MKNILNVNGLIEFFVVLSSFEAVVKAEVNVAGYAFLVDVDSHY